MDNTLKLIVAVLSLSGLLVMAVPNSDPMANQQTADQPVVSQSLPMPEGHVVEEEPVDEEGEVMTEEEGEEEFTRFGEPTMDGLPIGVSAQNDYGTATAEPDNNQQRGVAPPPMPVSDPVTPSNNDQPVSSSPPADGNY